MILNFPTMPSKVLIFVHIPKTGGSTVKNVIREKSQTLSTCDEHRKANDALRSPYPHQELRAIQAMYFVDKEDIFNERAFKISFVRNPWERLYSIYRWVIYNIKKENSVALGYQWHEEVFPLDKNPEVFISKRVFNRWLNYISKFPRATQAHWLKDLSGEINYDFIGRFENYEDDFKKILQLLDIDSSIPHINANPVSFPPYDEMYTQESIDLVGSVCKESIDLFGYDYNTGDVK